MSDTPNPGSDEARTAGCICAVIDNNHGKFPARPPDGWWVTEGCPVHQPAEARARGFAEGKDAAKGERS